VSMELAGVRHMATHEAIYGRIQRTDCTTMRHRSGRAVMCYGNSHIPGAAWASHSDSISLSVLFFNLMDKAT